MIFTAFIFIAFSKVTTSLRIHIHQVRDRTKSIHIFKYENENIISAAKDLIYINAGVLS